MKITTVTSAKEIETAYTKWKAGDEDVNSLLTSALRISFERRLNQEIRLAADKKRAKKKRAKKK